MRFHYINLSTYFDFKVLSWTLQSEKLIMNNKDNDDKSWLHIMPTILTSKDQTIQKSTEYWKCVLFVFSINNESEWWLSLTNSGINHDIVSEETK